jgi:hypothetical protein
MIIAVKAPNKKHKSMALMERDYPKLPVEDKSLVTKQIRAGACGECKVKVLEGQFDQGVVLDMALSPDEQRQGFGLM